MSIGLTTRRDSAPARDVASTPPVDSALARAARREFFTRDEAVQLLHDVRVSVDNDVALEAAVASVANDALVSYGQDQLVDRRRVIDPLLDIRLALTQSRDSREPEDWRAAG
jgi:hypothetical protein